MSDRPNGAAPEKRVAVVTGASRGIGRASAQALAASGWIVALGFRTDEDEAKSVLAAIEANGGNGMTVRLDLLDEDSVSEGFRSVSDTLGPVTGLVNNAGYSKDGLIIKYPVETYDLTMNTNVRGAYLCAQAALRTMLRARWGRIVNVSSAIAIRANAGQSAYATSKTALLGLTRSLAREVGGRGITVNAVCPGLLDTEMTSHLNDEGRRFYMDQTPAGRTAHLHEVADVVAFLMSGAASYVNGVSLPVDGGLTA